MTTRYWVSTSGNFTDANSWNTSIDGTGTAAALSSNDTGILFTGSVPISSNHTAINLDNITLKIFGGDNGYKGAIGSSGSPLGLAGGKTGWAIEMYDLQAPAYLAGSGTVATLKVIGTRKDRAFVYLKGGTWTENSFSDAEVREEGTSSTLTCTTQYFTSGSRGYFDTSGTFGTIYVAGPKVDANGVEVLPNPILVFQKKPAAIYASGGDITINGTSGGIYMEALGSDAIIRYNGHDSFTSTGGYHMKVHAGTIDFSKNPYNLGVSTAILIFHNEGSKLNLNAPGTTIAFDSGSSKKIGRGSRIYQGTATITGLTGDTGGNSGGSGGLGA